MVPALLQRTCKQRLQVPLRGRAVKRAQIFVKRNTIIKLYLSVRLKAC